MPRRPPEIIERDPPSPWGPLARHNAGNSEQLSSFKNGILSVAGSSHVVAPGWLQDLGGHFVRGSLVGCDTQEF